MKRTRNEPVEDESHVFDQTNGIVDLGDEKQAPSDDADLRNQVVYGNAILNTHRLSGI